MKQFAGEIESAADHAVPFVHRIKVRYGECDGQGVVFNANYLVYVDDVVDEWLEQSIGPNYLERFEYMVKKATLEWSSPARRGEIIEFRPSIPRWGTTSFDVQVEGYVGDRPVVSVALVCISIRPGSHAPEPIADWIKAALTPAS